MPLLGLRPDPVLPAWPVAGTVAILDLEFTAWEGSAGRKWSGAEEWREVVQIGMALADAGNAFAVREATEIMVRPLKSPQLSNYFIALTGIDQASLDREGIALAAAMPMVDRFLADVDMIIFNGSDGEVLRENCEFNGLPPPVAEHKMFNFRPLLARTLDRPANTLVSSDLPALAGISVSGRAHSAMHDCKSIAAAFGVWRRAGKL